MKFEKENFNFAGTKERYNKWEKEPTKVVNVLNLAEKELAINLPEALQVVDSEELTPRQTIDINNNALGKKDCPNIVFGRPHAGEYIPQEFWNKATMDGKKTFTVIDRGTSYIFKSSQIPSVGTKMSRFIIDPNRPPLAGMKIEGSKAPGEVLWKKAITDKPMFKEGEEPSDEKINNLSEKFYLPYYNAMMAIIGSLADRRKSRDERILVIDGHSFPVADHDEEFAVIRDHYQIKQWADLPLFIIGDRDGESCDQDIKKVFMKALEKNFQNLSPAKQKLLLENSQTERIISENEYMKGARNVQFYGQRQKGINALQLELNEAAFVDDQGSYFDAKYNMKKLGIIKEIIKQACLDVDALLKNKN